MIPKISIIVPVYNVELYLRDCVDSILSQTYTDFELILVDDGSTDNCDLICDQYAEKDKRITVIHKTNGGLSSARNAGVNLAIGEYIEFVDSDDTIELNTLENLIKIADESNADVVIFGINIFIVENGIIVNLKKSCIDSMILENKINIETKFAFLTLNACWNYIFDKIFRRKLIVFNKIEANIFYDKVCEDTIFLLDLFPYINKIDIIDKCYYNYFIRDTQSVVKKFLPQRFEKYYGRFLKTKILIGKFPISEVNINLLYELYLQFIIWSYELLFHKDCNYSLSKRYQYIRSTFSIDKESEVFKRNAIKYFINSLIFNDASKTTRLAIQYILRKKYLMSWIVHISSLLKSRLLLRIKLYFHKKIRSKIKVVE